MLQQKSSNRDLGVSYIPRLLSLRLAGVAVVMRCLAKKKKARKYQTDK